VFLYRAKCPAKVNLSLSILGEDKETGYHFIDTAISKIDLYDELELTISKRAGLTLRIEWDGEFAGWEPIDPMENTLVKAYNAINEATNYRLPGMTARLVKRIPTGTGLGGASSDAGGFIKLVHFLATRTEALPKEAAEKISRMSKEELGKLGFGVGADVPAFLTNSTVRVRGFGEAVEPLELPGLKDYRLLLAIPRCRLSTKEMYAQVARERKRENHTVEFIAKWLSEGAEDALPLARNDFEEIAQRKSAEIAEALEALRQTSFPLVTISGSGSAVIALSREEMGLSQLNLPPGITASWHSFIG